MQQNFKVIDLDTWPRNKIYHFFSKFQNPIFGVTSRLDITKFRRICKQKNISSYKALNYLIGFVCNQIPAFKQRINKAGEIIEYNAVGVAGVIQKESPEATSDFIFNFYGLNWHQDPKIFLKEAESVLEEAKKRETLQNPNDESRDDMIFISCLPWLDFTSFNNPIKDYDHDSYVRITWGKYVESDCGSDKNETLAMNVEVNHAFADGYHVGLFFQKMQESMNNSEEIFGNC